MKFGGPTPNLGLGVNVAVPREWLTGARPVAGAVGACSLMLLACSWFALRPGGVDAGRDVGSPAPVQIDDSFRQSASTAHAHPVSASTARRGEPKRSSRGRRQLPHRANANEDKPSTGVAPQEPLPAAPVQAAAPSPAQPSAAPSHVSPPAAAPTPPAVVPPVSLPPVPSVPVQAPSVPVEAPSLPVHVPSVPVPALATTTTTTLGLP
jgi:hypothetical protein